MLYWRKSLALTLVLASAVAGAQRSPIDVAPQINLTEHLQIQFDEPVSAAKARGISRLGFKLVRLPVTSLERDFIIEGSVRNLLRAGLNVVLDFHPDSTKDFMRTDDFWLVPAWWHNLATQFKGEFLDRLAFEIINEPDFRGRNTARYDAWLRTCIESIREVDDRRWIVASNPFMGDPDYFGGPNGDWTPPAGVDRLIVPMHYYRPFNITHPSTYLARRRGESVARGSRGAPYPPERDGSFEDRDQRNMGLHFSRYRAWCRKNNVWPWVGEAGCHEDVPGREQWFRDVRSLGAKNGVNICWWSTDGFAIGAKWDGDSYEVRHPEVLRILTGR